MSGNRMVWMDALRLLAGLSMVGLHATSDAQGQPWISYPEAERWGPILIRTVLYVARTELFLVISVFLLVMSLDRRPRTYRETITEQARRLLLPFAFWTVFFALYTLIKADYFGYSSAVLRDLSQPSQWIEYLLLGTSKYHMHFLPTLFGLILFYPLFLYAVRRPVLGLAVLAALILKRETDALIWANLYDHPALPWLLRGVKVLTYCGYGLVAGAAYGLWRQQRALRPVLIGALALGAVLFAFKLRAAGITVEQGAWPYTDSLGYWADFLMPVIVFLIAMCCAQMRWPGILSRLAPFSFGMYLCHPIFLDLVEIGLHDVGWSPLILVCTKIAAAVGLTAIWVKIVSQLPLLAWTIGLGPLPWTKPLQPQKV